MRVFVINLDRSAERKEAMESRLRSLRLEHEFFRAVDGAAGEHLSHGRFRPGLAARYGGVLTVGEAGCFASHSLLWAKCEAMGQPITILEDDVELDDRFPDALKKAVDTIADGALFVRLCGLRPRRHVVIRDVGDGYKLVRFLKGPSGTQAYVLSPGAAGRFGAAREWAEPVDDYIDRFWVHGVQSLAVLPYGVARGATPSSIGERPPLSVGARWTRKVRRAVDTMRRSAYNALARQAAS